MRIPSLVDQQKYPNNLLAYFKLFQKQLRSETPV